MKLPEDPLLLMSVVNTWLRDKYASPDALCEDLNADRAALEKKLAAAGYRYNAANNQYVRQ